MRCLVPRTRVWRNSVGFLAPDRPVQPASPLVTFAGRFAGWLAAPGLRLNSTCEKVMLGAAEWWYSPAGVRLRGVPTNRERAADRQSGGRPEQPACSTDSSGPDAPRLRLDGEGAADSPSWPATDLARDAVAQGCEVVIAAGGDGTVSEVADGLVGTSAVLAVLPMGTGNVWAMDTGVDNNRHVSRRLRRIQG
jgi:hypothetical protein